jgi:hypothetical protein
VRSNRIVIILVKVKNISANLPNIVLMVGMSAGQDTVLGERERERVIVHQNSCERVSDGGIHA